MSVSARQLQTEHVASPLRVNDVHSRMNAATVRDHVSVHSIGDVLAGLERAGDQGLSVSTCGGRHAMGGQQFASDGLLLDMSGLDRVLNFDPASGLIEVEAGIRWPKLMRDYLELQAGHRQQWGIRQKQTGADRLSIGGALAANIHGRVLDNKPIIEDVVSFRILDADGRLLNCSRTENPDLFRLVIGGYGLFGVIVSVTLELVPRRKVQRIVEVRTLGELGELFRERIDAGYLYGDFQFGTDENSDDFLERGIFSCYRPMPLDMPIPDGQRYMTERSWQELLFLAHTDKSRAFDEFSRFYLGTSGQMYWSDEHQFTTYLDDYHDELDKRLGHEICGSEMITELYVPRDRLAEFMRDAKEVLRSTAADLIYGTVRLIREDDESFLAWAKQDFACVIFNLHVEHSESGWNKSRESFCSLLDTALWYDGSYFLTYHRHATREQVLQAYPQFPMFLRKKRERDPQDLFSSDWYRHQCELFGAGHEQ